MAFDNIIGQTRIKKFFERALRKGRMSHAYLFVGSHGVGKEAMALEVAKAFFCSDYLACDGTCRDCARVGRLAHPDLHFIFPAPAKMKDKEREQIVRSVIENPYLRAELWANPLISIERIREIRRKAATKAFEGRGRVVIITDCERMTTEAANSLLKLLEEPPEGMRLVMISSRPNLLLPTITSRCQMVKFDPLSAAEIAQALVRDRGVDSAQAHLAARLASGSYRRAVELLDEDLEEMQNLSLDFFRASVQNGYAQIHYVEQILGQVQGNLKRLKDLLALLAFWFRDAAVVVSSEPDAEKLVIHANRMEVLHKFASSFPQADVHSAVQAIEESIELIDRNVQINLILIVLLNKLRTFVRR
ncbi:MAG: DNA polymerase III subunit delta' [Calditrichaeota bacterium]|nr:MAG: DNA polymerase III subunit delta' [Calditrichota bacterium]